MGFMLTANRFVSSKYQHVKTDYIIDPLADIDLEPLGDLIGDPIIEKVLARFGV